MEYFVKEYQIFKIFNKDSDSDNSYDNIEEENTYNNTNNTKNIKNIPINFDKDNNSNSQLIKNIFSIRNITTTEVNKPVIFYNESFINKHLLLQNNTDTNTNTSISNIISDVLLKKNIRKEKLEKIKALKDEKLNKINKLNTKNEVKDDNRETPATLAATATSNILDSTKIVLNKIAIPCLNCSNLIKLEDIDTHSENCLEILKTEINEEIEDKMLLKLNNKLSRLVKFIKDTGDKCDKNKNVNKQHSHYFFSLIENRDKVLDLNEKSSQALISIKKLLLNVDVIILN